MSKQAFDKIRAGLEDALEGRAAKVHYPKDQRTLREALEQTYRQRWAGTRSEKCLYSQAEKAVEQLTGWCRTVADVKSSDIQLATARWYAEGLSPATINKRLNCLSAMGIAVEGCRVKVPKVLKWWLRPEAEKELVEWLVRRSNDPHGPYAVSADVVQWTTRTGLRIEETLRLRWSDLSPCRREVMVPGLKTETAQATLALGAEPQALAGRHLGEASPFPIPYERLKVVWAAAREHFGWQDEPTATLKSLRRSAARYLHYDRGMPLDMVRQYLRHEDIETTMGYLRLTGGVSLDEQRRYLG